MIEVDEDRFVELAEAALATLPPQLAGLLDNVVLFVEDDAPAEEPDLLGLYDGVALTERDTTYGGVLPDRILIFRRPTLAICETEQDVVEVETVSGFGANDAILDIRSIDEQDDKPLQVEGVEVVSLPFYKLSTKFGDLDQSKTYLLWCERGVMSRLQALYLREQGFANVKVYRP